MSISFTKPKPKSHLWGYKIGPSSACHNIEILQKKLIWNLNLNFYWPFDAFKRVHQAVPHVEETIVALKTQEEDKKVQQGENRHHVDDNLKLEKKMIRYMGKSNNIYLFALDKDTNVLYSVPMRAYKMRYICDLLFYHVHVYSLNFMQILLFKINCNFFILLYLCVCRSSSSTGGVKYQIDVDFLERKTNTVTYYLRKT